MTSPRMCMTCTWYDPQDADQGRCAWHAGTLYPEDLNEKPPWVSMPVTVPTHRCADWTDHHHPEPLTRQARNIWHRIKQTSHHPQP